MMPSLVLAILLLAKSKKINASIRGRNSLLTAMDEDALPGACRGEFSILVLNKAGQIQWAKDGSLTPEEVDHVIALAQKLINE